MRPLKFNVHGNGFLQIQLDEANRIHVWHPSIPRQRVETPYHDHKFNFVSQVLAGTLLNVTLAVIDSPLGNYRMYTPAVDSTPNIDAKLVPLVSNSDLTYVVRPAKVDVYMADQSYQFQAGHFHHTVPIGPVMTRIRITQRVEEHQPRVMVEENCEPDNSFDRLTAMSEDDVWHLLDTAFPTLSDWVRDQVLKAQLAEDAAAEAAHAKALAEADAQERAEAEHRASLAQGDAPTH